jgi:hypothetical protein
MFNGFGDFKGDGTSYAHVIFNLSTGEMVGHMHASDAAAFVKAGCRVVDAETLSAADFVRDFKRAHPAEFAAAMEPDPKANHCDCGHRPLAHLKDARGWAGHGRCAACDCERFSTVMSRVEIVLVGNE